MLSASESKAENKRQALEQLRFNKNRIANRLQASSLAQPPPSDSPSQLPYPTPPTQSRDATISSRFFSSTPSSFGNVLVPSSSPLASETPSMKPYQPYGLTIRSEPSSSSTSVHTGGWTQNKSTLTDPLTAPSGLASTETTFNATLRRQRDGDETSSHTEAPQRKRINRGTSHDALRVTESRLPPHATGLGLEQLDDTIGDDTMSISSDDSLADPSQLLAGPSKPRLMKAPSTPIQNTPASSDIPPQDKEFISFRIMNPVETPVRVQAAWTQAGRNPAKAARFLADPAWSPSIQVSPSTTDSANIGRIKEVDDVIKAQRVANKEKGKRSMIYANRPILDNKTPTTPTATKNIIDLSVSVPATPASPITPAIKAPSRKRVKKLVIDSDPESGYGDSDDDSRSSKQQRTENAHELRALEYLNTSGPDALQELTGCTSEQAAAIIELRPFDSADDVRSKLGQGKKKAGLNGLTARMFDDCSEMLKGYGAVDSVLEDCERIGATLRATISSWNTDHSDLTETVDDGALNLISMTSISKRKTQSYLTTQPKLLNKNISLKEYQLLGVNWLNLLYRSNLSCILADEMGLGKTIQVISFLAHLKEQGRQGPHLVVVPSSTLENWCREFARFAPSIEVQTYYADKNQRPMLRQTLLDTQRCQSKTSEGWEVLITTYNLAQGDDRDRKFFRKLDWDCCVYDEGHVLKNFQSQRYQSLLKFGSRWRLLLTGTPLQNNLQELVSLLNFILPKQFAGSIDSLRAIFKVKGDTKITLLSQERISRAKKMMTPFVLRRRKDQVLKDLPNKTERIEWCDMTDLQRTIYREALQRSRKTVLDAPVDETTTSASTKSKKLKAASKPKEKLYAENSSNVLMDLRKAASHPMLFRTRFTDEALTGITKQLLKEPDFRKRGAVFDLVKEDMSVMTDSELQVFVASYKSTQKYLQEKECYVDAGKVKVLLELLAEYSRQGRKVLIFSQFTQILDILQVILEHHDYKFLVLTGSTPVDVRQSLVDDFTEDDSITVFLLSTKAGGMGINLTAASVVIMFDQDFNPHNDRQAQDRAYRIGQKRDVEVVKLISRGTIEEDMLRLGETKLALDEAVAGDTDEKEESAPERAMKTSLMNVLRQQFEREQTDKLTTSSQS